MKPMRPMVPSSLTEGSPWAMQLPVHGRKWILLLVKSIHRHKKRTEVHLIMSQKAHGGKMDHLDNYLGAWAPHPPRGWAHSFFLAFLPFIF
jgi:hypothetical protein